VKCQECRPSDAKIDGNRTYLKQAILVKQEHVKQIEIEQLMLIHDTVREAALHCALMMSIAACFCRFTKRFLLSTAVSATVKT